MDAVLGDTPKTELNSFVFSSVFLVLGDAPKNPGRDENFSASANLVPISFHAFFTGKSVQ
jgi:hypothetical protein